MAKSGAVESDHAVFFSGQSNQAAGGRIEPRCGSFMSYFRAAFEGGLERMSPPLMNAFPVVHDLPWQRSVKLSPSKTTEGSPNGNWKAMRVPSRVTGVFSASPFRLFVGRWFAITLVKRVEQERFGVLSVGYFEVDILA
jgi:hypothetical protein